MSLIEINPTEMSPMIREWWEHVKYIYNRMFGSGAAEKLMDEICGHNHPDDSDAYKWYREAWKREKHWDKRWL